MAHGPVKRFRIKRSLKKALKARKADIERLGEFNEDELHYLGHADDLADPVTDGLECNASETEGD